MKLYGATQSRAQRCLWMLEELGIDYDHEKTSFATDAKSAEYLKLNPNGKVPTLVDGDLVLFESLAINLYLARKYDGGLLPKSLEDQARALQWSIWAMTEVEPPLMDVLMNTRILPEDQRDPARARAGIEALAKPLGVLNGVLQGRAYLLGDAFTVADLNVAAVASLVTLLGVDLSGTPEAARWLRTCTSRPACEKSRSL